jgi:hypothetical protein
MSYAQFCSSSCKPAQYEELFVSAYNPGNRVFVSVSIYVYQDIEPW